MATHLSGLVTTLITPLGKFKIISSFLLIFNGKYFNLSDLYTRMYTDILVLDALYFRYPKAQFNESKIVRELKKCFSGFKTETNANTTNSLPVNHAAIATGNWGCGAFNGNRQLKCKYLFKD